MRVYFYGSTLAAAEKKGTAFVKMLNKAGDKLGDRTVSFMEINTPEDTDPTCTVKAYAFCVCVAYGVIFNE
ncbi:MAG: hypothetical protein GY861_14280 [bacterium]|nr:hypothetical protein [bacterium]